MISCHNALKDLYNQVYDYDFQGKMYFRVAA
jgi:hypothetical protein